MVHIGCLKRLLLISVKFHNNYQSIKVVKLIYAHNTQIIIIYVYHYEVKCKSSVQKPNTEVQTVHVHVCHQGPIRF